LIHLLLSLSREGGWRRVGWRERGKGKGTGKRRGAKVEAGVRGKEGVGMETGEVEGGWRQVKGEGWLGRGRR